MLTRFRTRSRTRGQAIVETSIMMPLFLLGLFGVFWTVRQSALTERIQLGVRYGGTVTAMHDAFLSYSLYAVYATLDGSPPVDPNTNCAPGSVSSVTSSRNGWWQPVGSVTTACSGAIQTIDVVSQKMLLENDFIGMAANAPVDAYLSKHALGKNQTPVSASENFFRSPDVGALVSCTTIGNAIKNSLEGRNDTLTTILPPTPIPTQMTVNPVIGAVQSCQTFAPQLPAPITTTPPTPYPPCTNGNTTNCVPTAPPTITPPTPTPPCTNGNTTNCTPTTPPTVTPTATPTPKPPCSIQNPINCIPTPTPTVAPTATPSPKPSASPSPCNNGNGNGNGNCPTASPSPSPSPPPPTASPKPTPTPTPNPSGTLPPGAVG